MYPFNEWMEPEKFNVSINNKGFFEMGPGFLRRDQDPKIKKIKFLKKVSIIRCRIQQVAYFYNKKKQLLRSLICFVSPLCEHTTTNMFYEVKGMK